MSETGISISLIKQLDIHELINSDDFNPILGENFASTHNNDL